MDSKQLQESRRKVPKQLNAYAKYTGLAVQMMLMICIGTYGGFRLDKYFNWGFPLFTVVLSLFSVGAAIWYAVKDLLK